mgnify:CR=1 FL=1|jgi:hypothetical protein
MGLDQYAYVASRANDDYNSRREIARWRKHPNLQGWMEVLWIRKTQDTADTFNGVELELSRQDIEQLEQDIINGSMADLQTTGFFFGNASDDYYREKDLQFIKDAKADLFFGLKVFYNSSW